MSRACPIGGADTISAGPFDVITALPRLLDRRFQLAAHPLAVAPA